MVEKNKFSKNIALYKIWLYYMNHFDEMMLIL